MSVKMIISAILFASAFIHSEEIDSADAEYCFDFRDKRQNLLFVRKNKGLEKIRNTEEVGCVHFYRTEYTEINFVDESGKNITYFSSTGLSGQYSDGRSAFALV